MALYVTDDCVVCGACLPECPSGAIFDGADQSQIDPARCDECGGGEPRCNAVCPTECFLPDPQHPRQVRAGGSVEPVMEVLR